MKYYFWWLCVCVCVHECFCVGFICPFCFPQAGPFFPIHCYDQPSESILPTAVCIAFWEFPNPFPFARFPFSLWPAPAYEPLWPRSSSCHEPSTSCCSGDRNRHVNAGIGDVGSLKVVNAYLVFQSYHFFLSVDVFQNDLVCSLQNPTVGTLLVHTIFH